MGRWLDNMGANLYGARSPLGEELRSFHLALRAAEPSHAAPPCSALRHQALRTMEAQSATAYAALLEYKDCAFSEVAQQQAQRLKTAVDTTTARLGLQRSPHVYGNGLKHRSAADAASIRTVLLR